MKTGKYIALLTALALFACLFSGCAGGGTAETTAAAAATAETAAETTTAAAQPDAVELSFIRIGNDTAEGDYWKDLIARYMDQNPGVVINYDDAAIGEAMETKLNTSFAAGIGYDIIGHGILSVASRVEAGHYRDITEYYNNWEGRDDIMQSVLANGTYKDRIYGLAYSTTPYVFAYRIDLFEEAGIEKVPETWDELRECAAKLTVREGDSVVRAGFAFPMSAGNFVEFDVFAFGNGSLYYDDAGNPTIDTPEKVEAMEFLTELLPGVNLPYSASDTNPFLAGNAAMVLINNVALTGMLKDPAYEGKVGIAVPPHNEGKEAATFSGCNMLFIGSTCKNPDAAFSFIEAALTGEEVLNRAKVLNIPVTRTSQVEAFIALDPMNEVRAACVACGIGMPRTTWATTFQTIRNTMVQEALYGTVSPADALASAQAQLLEEIG